MVITKQKFHFWKHIQCNSKLPLGQIETELMKKINQYVDQQQINDINQCHRHILFASIK